MAEPTCVMHAFSYPSAIPDEAQEENPMYAFEESVSLGRFVTESLSWEKWSSFSRNRYVEEAEMYSRPGSVKQKKAYFEAHFKKMAALKAAALLEQANPVQGGAEVNNYDGIKTDDHADLHVQDSVQKDDKNASELESEVFDDGYNIDDHHEQGQVPIFVPNDVNSGFVDYNEDELIEEEELREIFMDVEEQNLSTEMGSEFAKSHESPLEVEVFHECVVDKDDEDSGFLHDHNEDNPVDEDDKPLSAKFIEQIAQAAQVQSSEQLMDVNEQIAQAAQVESSEQHMDVDKQNTSTEMETVSVKSDESRLEVEQTAQATQVKSLEQLMDANKQNPSAGMETGLIKSDESQSEVEQTAQATQVESLEQLMDANKQNPSAGMETGLEMSDESRLEVEQADQATQVESSEQLMDVIKPNPSTEMETGLVKRDESRLQDTLPATTPRSKRNPLLSVIIPSSPMSKRNLKLSLYMPSRDAATSSLVPSSSPAAVHPGKENTFTPISRKSWIDEPDKKRTPLRMSINRELNRLISPVIKKIGSSTKSSNKDFTTPLKTPSKLSEDSMRSDPPEITPQSGKRRARALFDSAGCGGSKASGQRWQFLSTEGSKSPAGGRNKTSSPIIPKSFCLNTSRAPRRKERLEEKFNAKATESVQQQSKLKEKPKELTKLRSSFCFGAKLSSESFREREREKERLVEVSKEKSKGRSRLQNMNSLPPLKAATKGANLSKNVK